MSPSLADFKYLLAKCSCISKIPGHVPEVDCCPFNTLSTFHRRPEEWGGVGRKEAHDREYPMKKSCIGLYLLLGFIFPHPMPK